MHHRFHAPHDGRAQHLSCTCGDIWKVKAVAAIVVVSSEPHFLHVLLQFRFKDPDQMRCAAASDKGSELGWFEHDSTMTGLDGLKLAQGGGRGARLTLGQTPRAWPVPGSPKTVAASTLGKDRRGHSGNCT